MRRPIQLLLIAAVISAFGYASLLTSATLQEPSKSTKPEGSTKAHTEHSKLYKQYSGQGDLRVLVAKTQRDVEVVNGMPQQVFRSDAAPVQLGDFLRKLTDKSDAVVIGVVKDSASFLTSEGTFVFTDYGFTVEQILKNNPTNQLRPLDNVCITRPGGSVQLKGHRILALDEALAPLLVGDRYLLFLDYVPATGAYKAFNSQGSFHIQGSKAAKLTTEQLRNDLDGADIDVLAAFIRSALL
jgi:hypothetical protein